MDYLRTVSLDALTNAQRAHISRGASPVLMVYVNRHPIALMRDGIQIYAIHRDGESFRVLFDGVSIAYAIPGFGDKYEEPAQLDSWAVII